MMTGATLLQHGQPDVGSGVARRARRNGSVEQAKGDAPYARGQRW